MKDNETKKQFIELRASGLSFAKIAEQLSVSKQTLINWSQESETKLSIANLRAIEFESLQEQFFVGKQKRIELLGGKLNALIAETEKRDLSEIPTEKLFLLIERYAKTLREESEPLQLLCNRDECFDLIYQTVEMK